MNELLRATSPVRAPRFRLAACARCRGDAFLDLIEGEWRCLQCGRPVADEARAHQIAGALMPTNDRPHARPIAG